ncbi:nuclease-related domain-containing protein [Bacillus sp. AK128]
MFIKKPEKPIQIRQLESLLRRLRQTHPAYPKLVDKLAKQKAGYQGQKALDFYLQYLPHDEYFILHDLRLYDGVHYFQIDILILSSNYVLIIEVKNIAGTLLFDPEFNQLIRIHQDKEEGFADPILQVERQSKLLEKWLTSNTTLQNIPVESLVVLSNPSTILKVISRKTQIAQKVIHSAKLLTKIEEYNRIHPVKKIADKEIKKITKLLLKKHELLLSDFLEVYEIKITDLQRGALCHTCLLPMDRQYGKWKCLTCNSVNKQAHVTALEDYALLIKPHINNQEARILLNISSENITKRLLQSLNLPHTGKNKARRYNLDSLIKME